jgi:hypothetical protein
MAKGKGAIMKCGTDGQTENLTSKLRASDYTRRRFRAGAELPEIGGFSGPNSVARYSVTPSFACRVTSRNVPASLKRKPLNRTTLPMPIAEAVNIWVLPST